MRSRASLAPLVAILLFVPVRMSAGETPTRPAVARSHQVAVRSDFNGDGYSDVAIGVPDEDVGTIVDAGAVNVLYGSAKGLSAAGNQFWTQNDLSSSDGSETADTFGRSVATGDLNGDGYADLVVGVPHEMIGSVECGAIDVIYGSSAGLTATGNQFWDEDSPGILSDCQSPDAFARYVTVGDFNGDGYADVAASVGGKTVNGIAGAGAVSVLYGSAAGLTATGNQFWTENDVTSSDGAERNDNFGEEWVRGGDFNGDGYADLAISVRHEDLEGSPTITDAGAVAILYGSGAGLTADGNQFWTQDSAGILDQAEAKDQFGRHLAVADFNGDGFDDLAVGVRDEDVGTIVDAGAVNVIYGSPAGLASAGNQFWTENDLSSSDGSEAGDLFSRSITGGDFNGDGYDDIAIGIRDESLEGSPTIDNAGALSVIYGGPNGLDATAGPGNQFWTQDSPGIKDQAEPNDRIPIGLANADYNQDGFMDVILGERHEDIGTLADAGAAQELFGSAAGLTAAHNQFISQNTPGILDQSEAGDLFGSSCA